MEALAPQDLLEDAVEIAESRLCTGERLHPFMITDRWGDRRVEEFDIAALSDAKKKLGEFIRTAAGDERCVLVFVGRVGYDEDAIVIARGLAGRDDAQVFVQRFRPRRGRLRRFKLIGQAQPLGTAEPALGTTEPVL
jgi:hypothetical protein